MIDTLTLAERLENEAGETPTRARAFARILADTLHLQAASKQDLADLEQKLLTRITEVEGRLRADLCEGMGSLAWKMAGLLIAQGAAIVAIIKLIP